MYVHTFIGPGVARPTDEPDWLDLEEWWQVWERCARGWPEMDPLQLCDMCRVCPEGLISDQVARYIQTEALCSEYKCPPVEGGLETWPHKLVEAFKAIRNTHTQVRHSWPSWKEAAVSG